MSASRADTRTAPANAGERLLQAARKRNHRTLHVRATHERAQAVQKDLVRVTQPAVRRGVRPAAHARDVRWLTHHACSVDSADASAAPPVCRNGSRRSLAVKKSQSPTTAARHSFCQNTLLRLPRLAERRTTQQQAAFEAHRILRRAQDIQQSRRVVQRGCRRIELGRKLQRRTVRHLLGSSILSCLGAGARHARGAESRQERLVLGRRSELSSLVRCPLTRCVRGMRGRNYAAE